MQIGKIVVAMGKLLKKKDTRTIRAMSKAARKAARKATKYAAKQVVTNPKVQMRVVQALIMRH